MTAYRNRKDIFDLVKVFLIIVLVIALVALALAIMAHCIKKGQKTAESHRPDIQRDKTGVYWDDSSKQLTITNCGEKRIPDRLKFLEAINSDGGLNDWNYEIYEGHKGDCELERGDYFPRPAKKDLKHRFNRAKRNAIINQELKNADPEYLQTPSNS